MSQEHFSSLSALKKTQTRTNSRVVKETKKHKWFRERNKCASLPGSPLCISQ